jgi:hypothetical protein
MTDEAVKSGKIHDYKVVIVPQRLSEGYTLTRLNCMLTSVYFSANSTREQLRGRINRIGQKSKDVLYVISHIGILTRIMERYNETTSLVKALATISKIK